MINALSGYMPDRYQERTFPHFHGDGKIVRPNYDHIEKMSEREYEHLKTTLPPNYRKVRDQHPGAVLVWREKEGAFLYLDSLSRVRVYLEGRGIANLGNFSFHIDEFDFRWLIDYLGECLSDETYAPGVEPTRLLIVDRAGW